jgi:hypothetical protein
MKMILKIRTLICVVLVVGALLSTPGADASDSSIYTLQRRWRRLRHTGRHQRSCDVGSFPALAQRSDEKPPDRCSPGG